VYSDIVKNHFANPLNVGEIENPDGVGMARNEVDGDQVQMHIRVQDQKIVDAKIKVMGCVAAIASTSMLSEMIKGRTLDEAASLTKEELTEALGGLPENKIRCSLTCVDALQDAVEMIRGKSD